MRYVLKKGCKGCNKDKRINRKTDKDYKNHTNKYNRKVCSNSTTIIQFKKTAFKVNTVKVKDLPKTKKNVLNVL